MRFRGIRGGFLGVFFGFLGLFLVELGGFGGGGVGISVDFVRNWSISVNSGCFGPIRSISGCFSSVSGLFFLKFRRFRGFGGGRGGSGGVEKVPVGCPPKFAKPTCQIFFLHEFRPNTLIISRRFLGGSAGGDPHFFGVLLETNLGPRNR